MAELLEVFLGRIESSARRLALYENQLWAETGQIREAPEGVRVKAIILVPHYSHRLCLAHCVALDLEIADDLHLQATLRIVFLLWSIPLVGFRKERIFSHNKNQPSVKKGWRHIRQMRDGW